MAALLTYCLPAWSLEKSRTRNRSTTWSELNKILYMYFDRSYLAIALYIKTGPIPSFFSVVRFAYAEKIGESGDKATCTCI